MSSILTSPNFLRTIMSAYNIPHAALFDGSTGYLNTDLASAGDRQKWTLSFWFKPNSIPGVDQNFIGSGTDTQNRFYFRYGASGRFEFYEILGSATQHDVYFAQNFRDFSAWYHIVLNYDSTQGAANDRVKLYINGQDFDDHGTRTTNTAVPLNHTHTYWNSSSHTQNIGQLLSSQYIDMYMADVYFINGLTIAPSQFGAEDVATGNWIAKARNTADFDLGNTGFYLDFADGANLGKSGDRAKTVLPRFNDLVPWGSYPGTFGGDLMSVSRTGAGQFTAFVDMVADAAQDTYLEFKATGSNPYRIGMSRPDNIPYGVERWLQWTGSYAYHKTGGKYKDGSQTTYGASFAADDYIAIRLHNGSLTYYKNGISQGEAFNGISGRWLFAVNGGDPAGGGWELSPHDNVQYPITGSNYLSTDSLPLYTSQLADHFTTVPYSGTGAAQNITTGLVSTDFVWCKSRSIANVHELYDGVRGATARLMTDSANGENTETQGVIAFGNDTFSLGTSTGINALGSTNVAWCASLPNTKTSGWLGLPTITPVKETYNAELGMSIIEYTGNGIGGATVSHSLGKAPGMVVVKQTNTARNWAVGHDAIGWTHKLDLNDTAAAIAGTTFWNDTAPTDQLITLGSSTQFNESGGTYIAYIFAETDFCKIGSYTGNGSADGAFVNPGVKPAFQLHKVSSATGSWIMHDSERSPFNPADNVLFANLSDVESADHALFKADFLGNGVKYRGTSVSTWNNAGDTYIYLVIGEPSKTAMLQGQHWQTNGTVTQVTSTPTNTHICLDLNTLRGGLTTLSNGNTYYHVGNTTDGSIFGTFPLYPGQKYYLEFDQVYVLGLGSRVRVGVSDVCDPSGAHVHAGAQTGMWAFEYNDGGSWKRMYEEGAGTDFGSPVASNSRCGWAIDLVNGKLFVSADGTYINSGDPVAGTGAVSTAIPTDKVLYLHVSLDAGGINNSSMQFYFEEDDFSYQPTGYVPINTDNLPKQAGQLKDHFNTVLYTGDGSSSQMIDSGLSTADMVWLKCRTSANKHHVLYDTLRGATKYLTVSNTDPEGTKTDGLMAFSGGMFELQGDIWHNANGDEYVAWCTNLPSDETNMSGEISVAWKYNAILGMAVGIYTGTGTAGHTLGLPLINGTAPKMWVIKSTSNAYHWSVYHTSIGATGSLKLNTTEAVTTTATSWDNTEPTSSAITLGTNADVNASGATYVIYAFWETDFCKIGSYSANGSTSGDGPNVNLGGAMDFLMLKKTSGIDPWGIFDTARSPYNVMDEALLPNDSAATTTGGGYLIDGTANGFKLKTTTAAPFNSGSDKIIYLAFVQPNGPTENPAR